MTDETQDPEAKRGLPVWWAVGLAFIAIVGLVAVFQGSDDAPAPNSAANGETGLAAFPLQSTSGETVNLAQFDGQPLVINFFASWCGPCRAELPDFEAVHQELGDDVTFVGISRDNSTDGWRSLVDETGVTFDTFFEGSVNGLFEHVDGRGMPTTVFVSPDGEVQQVWSGILDDATLKELIAEHLA